MTSVDNLQWAIIGGSWVGTVIGIGVLTYKVKQLQNDWDTYRNARRNLLETMKNPDLIQRDFERGAAAMEARTANRLTDPRNENEAQRARVHRPKVMRPKMQTGWNPPADYDPRININPTMTADGFLIGDVEKPPLGPNPFDTKGIQ